MTDTVALCLSGAISAPVALARLLLGGLDAAGIAAAVAATRPDPPTPAWQALSDLLEGRTAQLDHLARAVSTGGSDHTSLGGVAGIATFFDRAVAVSPEAGVALYSLGDPAILEAGTAEIVAWLAAGGLLSRGTAVLDLGCGIGRISAALAPHCASVLGIDVSAGMVAEARRRHAGLDNVRFAHGDGSTVPPGPFDLVLMVDSMPYVIAAGLADRVVAGCAASRRPGGAFVVLNLSYGRPPGEDMADAARWATAHGWTVTAGHPFTIWDGSAFLFQ